MIRKTPTKKTSQASKAKVTETELKLALVEQRLSMLSDKIENIEYKVTNLCKLTNYGVGAWKSFLLLGTIVGCLISVYKVAKDIFKF